MIYLQPDWRECNSYDDDTSEGLRLVSRTFLTLIEKANSRFQLTKNVEKKMHFTIKNSLIFFNTSINAKYEPERTKTRKFFCYRYLLVSYSQTASIRTILKVIVRQWPYLAQFVLFHMINEKWYRKRRIKLFAIKVCKYTKLIEKRIKGDNGNGDGDSKT